jgi:PST family polysaccharide transporter
LSLAVKATRGAAWNLINGVGTRLFGLVGTLVITRFVAPNEYGEVSAATICVYTASMMTHLNFGQYVIAVRASAKECFTAFVYHLLLGVAAVIGVLLLRNWLGHVFDAPTMARFVPGFALALIIDRLYHIAERTMVRDLRFRQVALCRGAGEVTFTIVSLALAPKLAGMAIVVGNIARSTVNCSLILLAANRREWLAPAKIDWETTARLFRYCTPILIGNLAEFASMKWDNMLVCRFYGAEVMGRYNLAYNLSDTPNGNVADQIGDVLMPSFSRLPVEQREAALYRSAGVMALLIFPLCVGIGVTAKTLVGVAFSADWQKMEPMLALLAVCSVVRPLNGCLCSYTQAQQRPRVLMWMGLFKLVALLAMLCTVGRLGPMYACVAVVLAFALYMFVFLLVVHLGWGVSMVHFIGRASGPLAACTIMAATVILVRHGLAAIGIGPSWPSLIAEVVAGGLAYIGGAFVVARPIAQDVLDLARRAVARRAQVESKAA